MYINTYLIFLRTLKHRYYHYHFTLQETESQRDHMTFSMSFNLSGEDLAFSLRSARLQLISMLTSTVFLDVGKALSPFSDHHAVAKIMICCLYDCPLRLTYNRLRHYIPSIIINSVSSWKKRVFNQKTKCGWLAVAVQSFAEKNFGDVSGLRRKEYEIYQQFL